MLLFVIVSDAVQVLELPASFRECRGKALVVERQNKNMEEANFIGQELCDVRYNAVV
jgi:hypothetical protein